MIVMMLNIYEYINIQKNYNEMYRLNILGPRTHVLNLKYSRWKIYLSNNWFHVDTRSFLSLAKHDQL